MVVFYFFTKIPVALTSMFFSFEPSATLPVMMTSESSLMSARPLMLVVRGLPESSRI